ncbi:MAG TPA: isochorismatase family cysteine hydrolase [Pseudonocardia sp.]|uniref:isochorismatase family cysteine hydrolase n=1 Tax=Pseudonocardia sp. TaxID=60912 RepID=UPI002F3F7C4A
MKLDSSALLVVDVQNGFVTDETRHVVPSIVELVKRWHTIGGRTIYSRYFNYEGSAFERLMCWRGLYSPPDTDLTPELVDSAQQATVIDKVTYSSLTREMSGLVMREGLTDLVICGIDTDLCVLKTVLDVFEHGLTPWIVTDASASTGGRPAHNAGLVVIGRAVGEQQLVTSDELFTGLTLTT